MCETVLREGNRDPDSETFIIVAGLGPLLYHGPLTLTIREAELYAWENDGQSSLT